MFPDTFESIVASHDKGRILDFYADRLKSRTGDDDRDMLALRAALTEGHGEPYYFYRPPGDGWRPKKATTPGWLVRGAKVNGVDLVPDWLAQGYCSIAFPDLPEIAAGTSLAKIGEFVATALPDISVQDRRSRTGTLDRVLNPIKARHVVGTVRGPDVLVGPVAGPAEWVDSPDGLSSRRPVQWLNPARPLVRTDLSTGAQGKLSGQNVVTALGLYADEILALVEADDTVVT